MKRRRQVLNGCSSSSLRKEQERGLVDARGNLAYLQNDLADPVLRRHLPRLARSARARYEQLPAEAVVAGELRAGTDVRALARMIEVTLGGSFLAWTVY